MQQNFETTFDVDGNIETRSTSSQGNKDDTRSQRSITSSRDGNRYYYYSFHNDLLTDRSYYKTIYGLITPALFSVPKHPDGTTTLILF